MINRIGSYIGQQLWSFFLWGYGWKRDRYLRLGKPMIRWQDPLSMLWYSQNTALKLLKVQVIDQMNQKRHLVYPVNVRPKFQARSRDCFGGSKARSFIGRLVKRIILNAQEWVHSWIATWDFLQTLDAIDLDFYRGLDDRTFRAKYLGSGKTMGSI